MSFNPRPILALCAAIGAVGAVGLPAPAEAVTIRGGLDPRFSVPVISEDVASSWASAVEKAGAGGRIAAAFGGGGGSRAAARAVFGSGGFAGGGGSGSGGGGGGGGGGPVFAGVPLGPTAGPLGPTSGAGGGQVAVAPIPATAPLLLAALLGGGLLLGWRRRGEA